jgi:prepilin-type N-terminal cleavage/methylation domain-containing protein
MRRSNKGFTLLEIIIVIIIVGILASVAMPKLFSNIEFSHSAEALSTLGMIQRNVTSCSLMTGTVDWSLCGSFADIGMEDPSNTNWGYSLDDSAAAAGGSYEVAAERGGVGSGGDTITLTMAIDADGNVSGITKVGTGAFSKVK